MTLLAAAGLLSVAAVYFDLRRGRSLLTPTRFVCGSWYGFASVDHKEPQARKAELRFLCCLTISRVAVTSNRHI